ncbi:MAG: hypothetical protein ACOX8B_05415 [Lachnospiraceae bacterium]|jgi:hypothetical protein
MHQMIHLLTVFGQLSPDDFDFDYAARVPTATIVFMIAAIILAFIVPIWLFIHVQRRYELDGLVMLIGLVAYLLGGYIAPALLGGGIQYLARKAGADTSGTAYTVFMSALDSFMVLLSLWIGLKLSARKWKLHLGNLFIYAIGFSLITFMMNTVTNNMNLLSTALTINEGQIRDGVQSYIESNSSQTDEEIRNYLEAMFVYLEEICDFHPTYWMFLSLCLFMTLPNMLGLTVTAGGLISGRFPASEKKWLVFGFAVYLVMGIVESLLPLEAAWAAFLCYFAAAAAAAVPAYLLTKKYAPDDIETYHGKSIAEKEKEQHTPFPKINMPKDR